MTSTAATVPAYLRELPEDRRVELGKLRALIRKTAPGFKEGMKYGLPYYTDLCAFASQKQNMAFYVDPTVVDKYRKELGKLSVGKGCIRFRHLKDLPLDVVEKILQDTVALRKKGVPPVC